MDTKSLIIDIATSLFQQKGYLGVGLNEILKACNISKGSLYHHFPNGKEELLIACLQSMDGDYYGHRGYFPTISNDWGSHKGDD